MLVKYSPVRLFTDGCWNIYYFFDFNRKRECISCKMKEEIIVMYFPRNDGRKKREEQKNKAINFRQKEKDILDNILGKQDYNFTAVIVLKLGSKADGIHSYDARIRPASVNAATNETGKHIKKPSNPSLKS